jgi:flagellar motor protein MotB
MGKSTPLSQLQNNNTADNDNELVNEILREIDGGNNQEPPQQQQQQQPQQQQQQQQMMMEQQMMLEQQQQQQQQQMMMEQQMEMEQQPQMEMEQQQQLLEQEPEELSLIDSFMAELKSIIMVSVICIVVSLPQVADLLSKLLPNKAVILNNLEYVLVLVKGLLAGLLFFLAQRMG